MSHYDAQPPTTLEAAQELHRLYNLALAKTEHAWGHMTEVASMWEELGEQRQEFFIQFAKELRQEK